MIEHRIVIGYTGRYHEPVARWLSDAGLLVSAVNPKLIKDFGNDSLRKIKTDKADSVKIARYTLDKWHKLKQYGLMDELRSQLKTMNRQFGYYTKLKTAMKNNLTSLLEQTSSDANTFFNSPARSDGSQKRVDFVDTYWHVDRIRSLSLSAFTKHYQRWCSRKGYNFQPDKPVEIYNSIRNIIPVLPKDEATKLIVRQAVNKVNTASSAVEDLRTSMNDIASQLPEYPVILAMKGVGTSLGPQLMAEIGDVTRFTHKGALTAFAGVAPGKNESCSYVQKSVHTSKRAPHRSIRRCFKSWTV